MSKWGGDVGARRVGFGVAHDLFDDAIFSAVIRQHSNATTWHDQRHHVAQSVGQNFQLSIDLDANRLKRALRRVTTRATSCSRYGCGYHCSQLGGRSDWAGCDNGLGDALGESFIGITSQNVGDCVGGVFVHHMPGRYPFGSIHSHIEWGLVAVRKTTLG